MFDHNPKAIQVHLDELDRQARLSMSGRPAGTGKTVSALATALVAAGLVSVTLLAASVFGGSGAI